MKRWIWASVLTWLLVVPATAAGQVCEAGLRAYAVTGQQVHNHVADAFTHDSETTIDRPAPRRVSVTQRYSWGQREVRFRRGRDYALGVGMDCGPFRVRAWRFATTGSFDGRLESGEALRWYRIKGSQLFPVFNLKSCLLEDGSIAAWLWCGSPVELSARDRYRTLDGYLAVDVGRVFLGVRAGEQVYSRRMVERQNAYLLLKYTLRHNGELVSRGDYIYENAITLDWSERGRARYVGPLLGADLEYGPLRIGASAAYVRQFRADRVRFQDTDDIDFQLYDTELEAPFYREDGLLDGDLRLERDTPRWGYTLDAEANLRVWRIGLGGFLSYRDIPTNVELTNAWGTGSNKAPRAMEVEYRPRRPIVFTGLFVELYAP